MAVRKPTFPSAYKPPLAGRPSKSTRPWDLRATVGGVTPLPQVRPSLPGGLPVKQMPATNPWRTPPPRATGSKNLYDDIGADAGIIKSGDRNRILGRVAAIRKNRGLDGDAKSDAIWADRLLGGKASFGEVRRRLDDKSGSRWWTAASHGGSANVGEFPTTLPSLSAEDVADLAARRRAASASFEEALARGNADTGRAETEARFRVEQLLQKLKGARFDGMSDLAGRGNAMQPRFAGRLQRGLRDAEAEGRGGIALEKSQRLAAIQEMVNKARLDREAEFGAVDAETVRRKADLSRLISQIGG